MAGQEKKNSNYLEVVKSLAFISNVKELRGQVEYLIDCGHVSNEPSECDCGRSIEDHLKDLLNNFEFAKYFLTFAKTLAEYPEKANDWSKAICLNTGTTDWKTREDEKDLGYDYPSIDLNDAPSAE